MVGARRLQFKRDQGFSLTQTTNGINNTPVPIISQQSDAVYNRWLFDAKIVQHLTSDVMTYFSYGRGFRGPGANRGVPIPNVAAIAELPPETTDSYEIGLKGSFFDRRVRFNINAFQQDFTGFNAAAADIPFCPNYAPNCRLQVAPSFFIPLATSGQIIFAGDARVRGVEAEISASLTEKWSLQGTLAYANGKFKDAPIPYRPDLNQDGQPDSNSEFAALATQPIYFRQSSSAISEIPKWNFTVQSEYRTQLGGADTFVRGLFIYKGKHQDVSGANSYSAQPIFNLYLGARDITPGLEISLFAKNLFDTRKLTNITVPINFGTLPTGYREVSYTPPREVGITARFSFGGG